MEDGMRKTESSANPAESVGGNAAEADSAAGMKEGQNQLVLEVRHVSGGYRDGGFLSGKDQYQEVLHDVDTARCGFCGPPR